MRDERTKLLTFVNTWVDGVPQILAKMEDELEQQGEMRKQRKESLGSGWTKHYI
jgi:hypothetical protein